MKTMRTVNDIRKISVTGMMVVAALALSPVTSQGTVLYSENFDGEGTSATAYDNGTTPEVNVENIGVLQSSDTRSQGGNAGDNAWLTNHNSTGKAGLRFGSNDNWATGANSAAILAAGGFSVSFDFTANNDSWMAVRVGNGSEDSNVTATDVDYAALFRYDGLVNVWDNGASSFIGSNLGTTTGSRTAKFDYAFDSWNAGASVTFTAFVDGVEAGPKSFTWDGTDDVKIIFAGNGSDDLVDNIVVSTIPEPASLGLVGLMGAILLIRRRLYGNRK